MLLRWTWDPRKGRGNQRTHGLSFETARVGVRRPARGVAPGPSFEERWQTVGAIGRVIVFVVHTWPEPDDSGEEVGRIISARKATAHERKAYEEGRF